MNKNIIAAVGAIILLAGGFYGGMAYAKSSTPTRSGISPMNGQFRNGGVGGVGGIRTGAGFTAGEIISRDATSITIKMQDGSTKIILIGSGSQVMKTTNGSAQDLTMGTGVSVTGSANADGSITAQSIQIRPTGAQSFASSTPVR